MTAFIDRVLAIANDLVYPGHQFLVLEKGECIFLQVECQGGIDAKTGEAWAWKGRKWYLSPHMTDSEIVQTAFKAVVTAVEHEVREAFKYKGVAVCDPHLDLDVVVSKRANPIRAA